jgi:hypothetical protein
MTYAKLIVVNIFIYCLLSFANRAYNTKEYYYRCEDLFGKVMVISFVLERSSDLTVNGIECTLVEDDQ